MRKIFFSLVLIYTAFMVAAQEPLPQLKVSDNQRYLVTGDHQPFFWLGGTAWELIHRLNREQVDQYLSDRSGKGFNIIQTVILAELDGLRVPNAYGHLPLIDQDPSKLNETYFQHVDYVIEKAASLGLYVALLPTWGDKFNKRWGVGPEIFTPENARTYGLLLAERYLDKSNIVWVLGGDRLPENDLQFQIIRAMADGIKSIDSLHLMTYHPVGAQKARDHFTDEWLDFDMFQSGHSHLAQEYQFVLESREQLPIKPVINGEARYENILDRFWEEEPHGWLDQSDVRVSAYWSIISGAAGYTYGCNDIWQMYDYTQEPTIQARTDWPKALNLPGSAQMGYMKRFFEALPWYELVFDQSLILNENQEGESYQVSAVGEKRDYLVAYSPMGDPLKINLSVLDRGPLSAYWFNPRSATIKKIGSFSNADSQEFIPWAKGWGSDFLLVVVNNDSQFDFGEFMIEPK